MITVVLLNLISKAKNFRYSKTFFLLKTHTGSLLNKVVYQPAWQAQKGEGEGRGRKVRKRGKGKGAPAIRAGVLVFRPSFSELI